MRYSYNRYLGIAARVVRRSLKEDKRLAAEKRGEMDLRFAKWEVSFISIHPRHWKKAEDQNMNAVLCCNGLQMIRGHNIARRDMIPANSRASDLGHTQMNTADKGFSERQAG